MQKRTTLVGVLVILSFVLSAFSLPAAALQPREKAVTVGFELNFDSPDDLNNLEIWNSDDQNVNPDDVVKNGVMRISKDLHLRGARLGEAYGYGNILHTRLRASADTCFPVQLTQDALFEGDDNKHTQISGCTGNVMGAMLVRDMPEEHQMFGGFKLDGSVRVNPDEWLDFIFWLDPDGEKMFVLTGNKSEAAFGSLPKSDGWPVKDMHLAIGLWADSPRYLEVDFIRQAEGSITEYLAENMLAYGNNKETIDAFLKADPRAFPQFSEHQPVTIDPEQAPMGIVGAWLENQRDVWSESAEAWKDNEGGHFGSGSLKSYDDETKTLIFKNNGGENIFTPLNTPLDEYNGDEEKGNQAILFKFKAEPASPLYFSLLTPGDNGPLVEFCVDFWKEGKPYITMIAEFKTDPFDDGPFVVEDGKWYYMLMAMEKSGYFLSSIWEAENPENMTYFQDDLSVHPEGEKYQNASWKFYIGANAANTLYVEEYQVLTFDSILNK